MLFFNGIKPIEVGGPVLTALKTKRSFNYEIRFCRAHVEPASLFFFQIFGFKFLIL